MNSLNKNEITIPNLFIVGAAKAGTTALWTFLKTHPQVFMAGASIENKEPCFFVDGYGLTNLNTYLSMFINCNNAKVIGDASAAHLSSPGAAGKIYEFNPDAKIIICLRNPIDRAYSLYNWMVQEGYEWSNSFELALSKEPSRSRKMPPYFFARAYRDDYMYFNSGLYSEQVKIFLDLFGKNVKVIIFERMIKDPHSVLEDCMDFLGIEKIHVKLGQENPSVAVYSSYLQWFLRTLDSEKMRFNKTWPQNFFVQWGWKRVQPRKMSAVTRNSLIAKYESDIKLLQEMIQTDLTGWLT